jgi:hypothetical protein
MKKNALSYRCILNDDGDGLKQVRQPHDVSQVAGPIAPLKGTPVDCFCWCVAEEVASYKSEVLQTIYDLYDQGRTNPYASFGGALTDLPNTLYKQGIDYLPLLIEHAHAAGMAFFASFRMNDTHHKSDPEGLLAPEFWKAHPEYRLWGEVDAKSYYNAAFDYSHREVRERRLAAITEVARNYAVDGVELDMSRTPYFFQPDEAWEKRGILTDFLRELRARLQALGRHVPIMVRTVFGEDRLRHGGMDLRTWLGEGLVDHLVLTELANTFRADFAPWLPLCKEHGVPFYPALEGNIHIDRRNFYDTFTNPDATAHNWGAPHDQLRMLRAAAQNYAAQDISGFALFNLPARPIFCDPPAYLTGLFDFLHHDKTYYFWKDLPIWVEALRPAKYHQTVEFPVCGADIGGADSQVTLSFRQMAVPFPHATRKYRQPSIVPAGLLTYTLNGVGIEEGAITRIRKPAGRIPSGFKLKSHERIEVSLPGTALRNGTNTLAFAMPKQPTGRDPYVYIFELDVEIRF